MKRELLGVRGEELTKQDSPAVGDVRESQLIVNDLCQWFAVGRIKTKPKGKKESMHLRAVDGVSFRMDKGETLGLVGETGCGKTTLGKSILRLLEPTSGQVIFEGNDLGRLSDSEMRKLRLRMQLIFQDPYGSLNARLSVGNALKEPLLSHKLCSRARADERVEELLNMVGLKAYHMQRFPHEFSGGQRQRIAIARALTVNPRFIVCDEPVSALDVSIQAQIINLLIRLKNELDLTYLFISHDLLVVRYISDRIGVMYLGKLVELATAKSLFESPLHPYTKALFSAIPVPRRGAAKERVLLEGELPSPIIKPVGCAFAKRCAMRKPVCEEVIPELGEVMHGHFAACHFAGG